ncbi:adenylate/guanylate cyclase domain-containing protein [Fodinicurvata sp. EGI_FJ10296]|uniref:CHASE2 domain-containing protein n=1 Tax=Fodinicurvata sp. EGI_FJ10296 TaxID=3231908 RepID=UPI003452A163
MAFFSRTAQFIVGLIILVAAIGLRVADPEPIERLRLTTFDTYQRLQPRDYQPAPVRIVDIDDQSLAQIGQWPWPRTVLARLTAELAELGTAAIVFDIVFSEADRASPTAMAENLAALGMDADALEPLSALPDNDDVFAAILEQTPAVLGFVLTADGGKAPALKAGMAHGGDDPGLFVHRFGGAVSPLDRLQDAASGVGSLNMLPEPDAVVRRVPLLFALGEDLYPSLSAEALRVAQGASTYISRSSGASGVQSFGTETGITDMRIGRVDIPTDPEGAVWVHYTEPTAERYVSASSILNPDAGDDTDLGSLFDGNIVFIGTSASALGDLRRTPLQAAMPGVEVHAQAVEQMLLGTFITRPDWASGAEVLIMAAAGILVILVSPLVGAIGAAVAALIIIGAGLAASWWAFSDLGLLIDPVYPAIAVAGAYMAQSLMMYLRSEGDRRQIRLAFAQYLSPAMVDRISRHPDQLRLGGEVRDMTILFSDVRGFTKLSENLEAVELTRLISRFLTPMSDIIMARNGTIDKYMGDCIMAFWNAPIDDADHARNACRAAIAMRRGLSDLNAELAAEMPGNGNPIRLDVGVGINTGHCVVGNMGSLSRFDYTALGDAVNLASRIEGLSPAYGAGIVIGETTRKVVDDMAVLELDLIRVKGKQAPSRIHALLGDTDLAVDNGFAELRHLHEAMLTAVREQDWAAAEAARNKAAENAQAVLGDTELAATYRLYAERIARYRIAPPPSDWDGVFDASSKSQA